MAPFTNNHDSQTHFHNSQKFISYFLDIRGVQVGKFLIRSLIPQKTQVPYMVVLPLVNTLALNINYKQASPFVCIQNTPFSYYIHGTTLVTKCIYAMSSSKIARFQNSLGLCNILSICQYNPSSQNPTLAPLGFDYVPIILSLWPHYTRIQNYH